MKTKDTLASAKVALAMVAMIGVVALSSCGNNDAQTQAPAAATPAKPANPLVGSWILPAVTLGTVTETETMTVQDGKIVFRKNCKTKDASIDAEVTVAAEITDKQINLKQYKQEEADLDLTPPAAPGAPAAPAPGPMAIHTCRITPFFFGSTTYTLAAPKLEVVETATGNKTNLMSHAP